MTVVGCDPNSDDDSTSGNGNGGNSLVGTRWVYGNLAACWGVTVTFTTSNALTVIDTGNPGLTWHGSYSKSGDTINATISNAVASQGNVGSHAGTFVWTIVSGSY
jgi:hypothetical protein